MTDSFTDDAITSYWSPWEENGWHIPIDRLGAPSRDARRYQPPIAAGARRLPYVVGVAVAAPALWLVARLAAGASIALPLGVLVVVACTAALILFGPKWVALRGASAREVDVELQLRLACEGTAALARVVRVTYARQKTRAGYRDGTAIDTASGVAHLELETPAGVQKLELEFDRREPSLEDRDEVTILYLADEPSVWLPVFRMNDIELPLNV